MLTSACIAVCGINMYMNQLKNSNYSYYGNSTYSIVHDYSREKISRWNNYYGQVHVSSITQCVGRVH